uniref:Secreted protein n=1 Tax=Hucho hucho TaxID=62062 RepID=A0A4W5P9Z6_9TELE
MTCAHSLFLFWFVYGFLVTQYVTWSNDETLGGIEGCITSVALCPTVMGHLISTGLELWTVELARSQQHITPRERLHVRAMEHFSKG